MRFIFCVLTCFFIQLFGSEDIGTFRVPKRYMFSQQMAEVCFLSCWHNLKHVQYLRNVDGCMLNESGQFLHPDQAKTRVEWFLDTALPFAQWYKLFKDAKSLVYFSQFLERVKTTSITVQDGEEYLKQLDEVSQLTGKYYFPHLLTEDEIALHVNNVPFSTLLKIEENLVNVSDVNSVFHEFLKWDETEQRYINLLVISVLGHFIPHATHALFDEDRVFYNFGLYKIMLMVLKVNKNNDIVDEFSTDGESLEILDFYRTMNSVDNPWKDIDREFFLEYRVARIFKENNALKQEALSVVDIFFKSFGFYWDARDKLGLTEKMQDLPGEDQILAYCFCQSLRKIYTACINHDALAGVIEFDKDELESIDVLRLKDMFRTKFYEVGEEGKSYADVWRQIKQELDIKDGNDFVTFDGHGAVLSFDARALKAQIFEDRDLAEKLGFAIIDSSYAKNMKPFYVVSNEESEC